MWVGSKEHTQTHRHIDIKNLCFVFRFMVVLLFMAVLGLCYHVSDEIRSIFFFFALASPPSNQAVCVTFIHYLGLSVSLEVKDDFSVMDVLILCPA